MDLVSTPEIADMFGVSRQRVDQLSRTEAFPPPVAELKIGRVWRHDEIVAYGKATGRLPLDDDPSAR